MQYSLVSFLLITSSLLVSINLQLSVRAADTAEYANCSQPITCGSVESSLSYPFWGANRPEYCGKSGFEVTCQDTVPMISMGSVDFRILNMSASGAVIPTVTVAREDYWNDICPSNYVNTSLNFSLFDYASGPQNVSFSYCNPNATTAFVAMAATMGVCNSSVQVFFLTETQTAKISSQNTNGDCSNVVLVPVSATATEELDNNKTSIQKAIDGGFDLNVQNVDTGLCNNCVASGGVCGQTTTDTSFMCFCQDSSSTKACNGNSLTNPNSSSGMYLDIYSISYN
ncbi:hypothetical protein M0R45_032160 [Rubus argutus]|uniref:non-specific serine/threonine protein kinase n=1 Tax=Rubus argutus TaxID=59490 RepID=A0AAW1WJQ6_RUBAR